MIENRKQVLGRGLSALLESSQDEERQDVQASSYTLPIELILPGRHQPRVYFSQDELSALSISIQEKGILQPVLVILLYFSKTAVIMPIFAYFEA